MGHEEDCRRQEFDHRWQEEEEAYLHNEYSWLEYQIVPVWYDFGNLYEQYPSESNTDYERRRQAQEIWMQDADDRWRNGEDAGYLRKEICWKDYEWITREALERMKQEERDRRQEFNDSWRKEEEDYRQKKYQWRTNQIVPVWYEDVGNSYQQYPRGRRGDYESFDRTADSSNHPGSETSTPVQENYSGMILATILAAGLAASLIYMGNRTG